MDTARPVPKISNLPYDEAYEKIKTITNFGKSLSEKNSDIIITLTSPFIITKFLKNTHFTVTFLFLFF